MSETKMSPIPGNKPFEKGHPYYPPKPKVYKPPTKKQIQARLQEVMVESLPPERFAAECWRIFEIAVEKKQARAARDVLELMASYTFGKPQKRVEVEHEAGDVLAMWLENRKPMQIEEDDENSGAIDVDFSRE